MVQERIIHNAQEFCVVNKPPGVPSVPVVSNVLECCVSGVSKVTGQPFSWNAPAFRAAGLSM